MDKNTVKPRSIPLEAPYSAATLHRFLSDHPKEAGVKIKGAFKTPVLKVRKDGPKRLDDSGRQAWSFYLRYLHQRLVGTEQADKAGEEVEALLKKEPLKLSVGMLLVPLQKLMLAEQARLAKANGIVRRWLAHEKEVLGIAIGEDRGDEAKEKVERDKAALETACKFLAKFSDCKDGEIDTNRILEKAYEIGHQLSKEDLEALGIARLILAVKAKDLSAYIGLEVQGLLDLCISANGRDKKEFRSDTQMKNVVANIATAMAARTDNEEYLVPQSPRTIASRTNVRASVSEFAAPDRSSRRGSEKENEKAADDEQSRTTPPRKAPPATPKRGSPEGDSGLGRSSSGSSLVFPSSAASSSSGVSSASAAPGMSSTLR